MPPRRKGKQVVNKLTVTEEEYSDKGIQREAERQMAAVKAFRDVKIGQSLTALRLLCSYYDEEQLQKPVLEFFKENLLPGLSFDEENGEIALKWNNDKSGADFNYSILKSMGLPDLYTSGAYELPYNVRATLLGTQHNTHLQNLGTAENQMLASHDALQTPAVNGQRPSFGMTPRQPKAGEMMLSVHGSPLGGLFRRSRHLNEENS